MSKLFNLVKINTATTGTGTVTFGAAVGADFFTPAEVGVADGNTVSYILIDGTDVELGTGVVGGSVTTMTRTVIQSKIGGVAGTTKLNLSGVAVLALVAVASDILTTDDAGAFGKLLLATSAVSDAWTELDASSPASAAFRLGNVLGTVSEIGGVPTGALIERGSNSAGEYARFADGTQICWYRATVTNQAISSANGSYLFFGDRSVALPATFSSAPIVCVGTFNRQSSRGWGDVVTTGTSFATLSANSPISSASGANVDIAYIAIGPWF